MSLTKQGELLQQMAVNRSRLGVVLAAALEDMPAQDARAAEFEGWEAEVNAYHVVRCGVAAGFVGVVGLVVSATSLQRFAQHAAFAFNSAHTCYTPAQHRDATQLFIQTPVHAPSLHTQLLIHTQTRTNKHPTHTTNRLCVRPRKLPSGSGGRQSAAQQQRRRQQQQQPPCRPATPPHARGSARLLAAAAGVRVVEVEVVVDAGSSMAGAAAAGSGCWVGVRTWTIQLLLEVVVVAAAAAQQRGVVVVQQLLR